MSKVPYETTDSCTVIEKYKNEFWRQYNALQRGGCKYKSCKRSEQAHKGPSEHPEHNHEVKLIMDHKSSFRYPQIPSYDVTSVYEQCHANESCKSQFKKNIENINVVIQKNDKIYFDNLRVTKLNPPPETRNPLADIKEGVPINAPYLPPNIVDILIVSAVNQGKSIDEAVRICKEWHVIIQGKPHELEPTKLKELLEFLTFSCDEAFNLTLTLKFIHYPIAPTIPIVCAFKLTMYVQHDTDIVGTKNIIFDVYSENNIYQTFSSTDLVASHIWGNLVSPQRSFIWSCENPEDIIGLPDNNMSPYEGLKAEAYFFGMTMTYNKNIFETPQALLELKNTRERYFYRVLYNLVDIPHQKGGSSGKVLYKGRWRVLHVGIKGGCFVIMGGKKTRLSKDAIMKMRTKTSQKQYGGTLTRQFHEDLATHIVGYSWIYWNEERVAAGLPPLNIPVDPAPLEHLQCDVEKLGLQKTELKEGDILYRGYSTPFRVFSFFSWDTYKYRVFTMM